MLKPSELRRRAEDYRTQAAEAADPLWEVTLHALAEEFEEEAVEGERLEPGASSERRA